MQVLGKNPEWLRFQEIARAWSEETGESAQALEGNFREWFKEFLVRNGYVVAGAGDTADEPWFLEKPHEGRPIWRDTFEIFCEERGLAKPRFWFPDELAQPAEVSRWSPRIRKLKSSALIRAVILVFAILLSWGLLLIPIWLLIRWLLIRG